jgi:hypothetical protein
MKVVDRLEAVQVDEQQSHMLDLARGVSDRRIEQFEHPAAVVKPRQSVAIRQPQCLGLAQLQGREFAPQAGVDRAQSLEFTLD